MVSAVDRATLSQHLNQAERHVILGERHVARQRQLVAGLEASGLDASRSRALLATFEDLLVLHKADRDRLRYELVGLEPFGCCLVGHMKSS